MLTLLAVHLVVACAAPTLVGWLGRRAFWVLALAPASAAVWALAQTGAVRAGRGPAELVEWIPQLGLHLEFRLDTLSWLMTVIVGGVGALVLVYCAAYFKQGAAGLGRFGGVFVAFAGSMLGLVTADNVLLLFVFWELTTVTSYLLIGHYTERKPSRRAATQAIVVTTAGGLTMLVGLVILGQAAGTYRLSALLASPPHGTAVTVAVVCLLIGAATKSALIPFHFWLPAAMAAPTPVSAYLHAAAMVKAGVYLVARFAPAYADLTVWRWLVVCGGGGTLLLGGYRALRQHDLKLILAFGTVSQLGLIVLLVGLGTPQLALAGLAMLGAHAMFKASLFLVVGAVDTATGTRDLRRLSGLGRRLPWLAAVGALATASMIGLPPFAGFVAKEAALDGVGHLSGAWGPCLLVLVALGSVLTVGYGVRGWWGAFATKPSVVDPAPVSHHHARALVGPPAVLAVLGLVLALVPGVGATLLTPGTHPDGTLALWHGWTPVLGITLVVLALGAGLFAWRDRVAAAQARLRLPGWCDAGHLYRRAMARLDSLAAAVTGRTQRGSMPTYVGLVLIVWVVTVGLALSRTSWPSHVRAYDEFAQVPFALATVVAAVLAARARRRLKAVILAGVGGYAVAGIFLLYGAPDLALTQVLVETVTMVVFVLVLRRLPPYFSDRPLAASRWVRLGIGVAAGLLVAAVGFVAPAARIHIPVSDEYAADGAAHGGGTNIVNVALVDIRAWDTMGEISVLLVAATGVAALVFVSRRTGRIFRTRDAPADRAVWDVGAVESVRGGEGDPAHTGAGTPALRGGRAREWLAASRTLAPQRRSVIVEVVVRLIFRTMLLYSLYLLFSGHNRPGGGFAAGLVAGLALTVRYLAGGRYELGDALPLQPGLLLGVGLALSAGVGLVAQAAGGSVLQAWAFAVHLPVLGEVHITTSLGFDVGVYLVVVGLVLDVLRSLGAELDRRAEDGTDPVGDLP